MREGRHRPFRRRWCSSLSRASPRFRVAFSETELLEPGERPTAVGFEVAFLLGEHLVDEGERFAYGHPPAGRASTAAALSFEPKPPAHRSTPRPTGDKADASTAPPVATVSAAARRVGPTGHGSETPSDNNVPADTQRPGAGRFRATATLSPKRIGPQASQIAEEVVSHLNELSGADVRVTLELEVTVPEGVPRRLEHIVTENSASMRFDTHAFEES